MEEGVQRIYKTGIELVKERYVPTNLKSFIIIVCSTTIMFLIVDYFMKFRVFRWIYWSGLGLIVFFVFVGWTNAHELTAAEKRLVRLPVSYE